MNQNLNELVTLRLDTEQRRRLEELARREDRSISSAARRLIALGLAAHQQPASTPAMSEVQR